MRELKSKENQKNGVGSAGRRLFSRALLFALKTEALRTLQITYESKKKEEVKIELWDRRGREGTSHTPPPGGPAGPVFHVTLASGTLRRDEK